MKAQPMALPRPAAPNKLLLLSLVLGGTLLSGSAWAAGSVTFNQMVVERCPESSCEWRLSCAVGGGQETELVPAADARTKHKVNINRSLGVPQFPATIRCTAWEDDGWFGATWEEVGNNSVEVSAGGDFRLDISNTEQGTVRILMSVDSLEIALPAPAAAAAEPAKKGAKPAPVLRFSGTFNPSSGGRAVVVGLDLKAFKETRDKLASQGLQLADLGTFEHGGKRLWNGIFQNSQEQITVLIDQDWDTFSSSWKKLTGGRMRLTNLEVYPSGGKNTFAGIYRELGETHAFWVGQKRDEFLEKVKELSMNKGEKLLDVEVYRPSGGGALLYAGPFRQSSLESSLWTAMNRAAFEQKLAGIRGKEWQVVDLETYKDGKERSYDALLRTGPNGEVVLDLDAAAFTNRWRELAAKGLRLVSLEVYQE